MRHDCWLILALILFGLAAPATRAQPAGPSFSCAKPSEIEAVICGDPGLAADDRRMTAFYQIAKSGALGMGSNQLAAQREWLKTRDKDCAKGAWRANRLKSLRDCVAGEYNDRLQALAIANLIATPQDSLAELRRVNPKVAPIYEAALAYATIDDAPRRAKTVEAQLAAVYAAMDQNSRDLLATPGGKPITARDAAGSDSGFASFFVVSGTLDGLDLTWPCAVLLKRPGLVEGLGAFFGGSTDGAVPGSDCEAAMPPVPEVANLSDLALAAQAPCDGTIRFSNEREYMKLGDAIRLHRTETWETTASDKREIESDERTFPRKNAAVKAAAERALAAYYERYFAVVSSKAAVDAKKATDALVSSAFAGC